MRESRHRERGQVEVCEGVRGGEEFGEVPEALAGRVLATLAQMPLQHRVPLLEPHLLLDRESGSHAKDLLQQREQVQLRERRLGQRIKRRRRRRTSSEIGRSGGGRRSEGVPTRVRPFRHLSCREQQHWCERFVQRDPSLFCLREWARLAAN